jgi:hypothetical protein
MKRAPIQISDKALLQYLARVQGMDIRELRKKLTLRVALLRDHPAASSVIVEGFRYIVNESEIIAVNRVNAKQRGVKR